LGVKGIVHLSQPIIDIISNMGTHFMLYTQSTFYLFYGLSVFLLFTTCSKNLSNPEFEDDGSFYYFSDSKIYLEKSLSKFTIEFEETITPDNATQVLKNYSVRIDYSLYSKGQDISLLIKHRIPIILTAERGTEAAAYITNYPRNNSSTILGDRPEVKYCLPCYREKEAGGCGDLIFLTDRIVLCSDSDSTTLFSYLEKFKLEYIPEKYLGPNVYVFDLTDDSPTDPLSMANEINMNEQIIWAEPNWICYNRNPE